LEVALADGNKSTSGQIFRCEKDGKITFSDSICEKAPDKKRIIPGPLNSYSSEEQDNLRYPDSRRAKSKSNQSGTSSAAGAANGGSAAANRDHGSPTAAGSKPQSGGEARTPSITEEQARHRKSCEEIAVALEKNRHDQLYARVYDQSSATTQRIEADRQRLEKNSDAEKCR